MPRLDEIELVLAHGCLRTPDLWSDVQQQRVPDSHRLAGAGATTGGLCRKAHDPRSWLRS